MDISANIHIAGSAATFQHNTFGGNPAITIQGDGYAHVTVFLDPDQVRKLAAFTAQMVLDIEAAAMAEPVLVEAV